MNDANQSYVICRANSVAGEKAMTLNGMRVGGARPVACERSQIVNSHHENSKLATAVIARRATCPVHRS
jgi:hypothetical protein